jgi:hypothetical protein
LNLVITSSDIFIRISFERVLRNIQKNLLLTLWFYELKTFLAIWLVRKKLELAQALKYRSVNDLVRAIREIVRRREETTGHSVRPK